MGRVYYIKDRDGWFYDTTGVWHMPSEMFLYFAPMVFYSLGRAQAVLASLRGVSPYNPDIFILMEDEHAVLHKKYLAERLGQGPAGQSPDIF